MEINGNECKPVLIVPKCLAHKRYTNEFVCITSDTRFTS